MAPDAGSYDCDVDGGGVGGEQTGPAADCGAAAGVGGWRHAGGGGRVGPGWQRGRPVCHGGWAGAGERAGPTSGSPHPPMEGDEESETDRPVLADGGEAGGAGAGGLGQLTARG